MSYRDSPLLPLRPPCRHCGTPRSARANDRRGLCWGCYSQPRSARCIPRCYAPPARGPLRGVPKGPGSYRPRPCRRCGTDPALRARQPGADRRIIYPAQVAAAKDAEALGLVPTSALPGSTEKLLVLQARASRGLPLWHPDDATEADDEPVDLTLLGSVAARYLERTPAAGSAAPRGELTVFPPALPEKTRSR